MKKEEEEKLFSFLMKTNLNKLWLNTLRTVCGHPHYKICATDSLYPFKSRGCKSEYLLANICY